MEVPDADAMVITGIMADDEKNRNFAIEVGVGDIPFPRPYRGSTEGRCEAHGGRIWIGPELTRALRDCHARRRPYVVLCLICALPLFGAKGEGIDVVQLTSKREGE